MDHRKVTMRLTEEVTAGVRAEAERLGIVNTNGAVAYHGKGSVTGLVRAIGLGKLKVVPKDTTE